MIQAKFIPKNDCDKKHEELESRRIILIKITIIRIGISSKKN